MNYQKIYDNIVEKARKEIRSKNQTIYYEAHHIVPKCMNGEGSTSQWRWHPNIVLLTAKEHYLCHRLLCNIYPENHKLAFAFWHLCNRRNKFQALRFTPSGRAYQEARERLSKLGISEEVRQKIIKTKASKLRKLSVETIAKIKATKIQNKYIPSKEAIEKGVETRKANGSYGHSKESAEKRKQTMALNPYKHSEETLSKLRKPKTKVECPHCGKIGGISAMKRHHFDNCKYIN